MRTTSALWAFGSSLQNNCRSLYGSGATVYLRLRKVPIRLLRIFAIMVADTTAIVAAVLAALKEQQGPDRGGGGEDKVETSRNNS